MQATSDKRPHRFAISLNYGLTSKKTIRRVGDTFYVHNHIDNSDVELLGDEIMDDSLTNIGKAMKLGSFWMV